VGDSYVGKSYSIVPSKKSGVTFDPNRSDGDFEEEKEPYRKSGTVAIESRKYSVLVEPSKFKSSDSDGNLDLSDDVAKEA